MEVSSNVTFIILSVVLLTNIVIAMFVHMSNPKSATNNIFALLSLVISAWLVVMYIALEPYFFLHILLITRLTVFIATPMSILFFLLAYVLPDTKFIMKYRTLAVISISAVVVMILTLTPYVFKEVVIINNIPKQIPAYGMALFGSYTIAFSIAAVYILVCKTKKAVGIIRQQLRFITTGLFLMLMLITLTIFLPTLMFQNDFFVPFTPLYVLIFLVMTAYAIIKYQFLDIRLVVARTVSFTMLLIVAAAIYTCLLFAVARYVFQISLEINIVLFAVALTVVIALSFDTLRSFIQKVTNKVFFKKEYNSEKLFSEVTHVMARTIDLERLTNTTLAILVNKMEISRVAFLIVDNHQLTDVKSVSVSGDEYKIDERSFQKLKEICPQGIKTETRFFVFRDMEEGEQKQLFRTLGIYVAIPIKVKGDCVAILLLDKKLSGEIYFQRDIDFLDVFSSGAGIAIQNAKAYQKIKKFSEELEQRVNRRTGQLKEVQKRELKKAKDVARLKDEFVFIATHELRAPVTAIRMFLELLPNEKGFFTKDIQEKLDSISQASDHLNHLINDILEIARSEASAFKIAVQPTGITKIIRDVAHELSSTAEKKNVKLFLHMSDKLPEVMADPQKVTEVITNLLSNAIKYNRDGGTVNINTLDQGAEILVEIKDDGYGIPKERQEKIFQKFFRAPSKETISVLGTGLGLFITRMLVEKMGGKIMFSSVQGKGTTFAFSLLKAEDK